jgi:hypothetical protein
MIENKDRQLYQYKNSTRLNILLDRFYDIVKEIAPDNLQNFFNIDLAEGVWLTHLAQLQRVSRNYFFESTLGSPFILDISDLDSEDILDGVVAPVDDILLRALLKARILRNTVYIKSIDYVYRVFEIVLAPHSIIITEQPKIIEIEIDFNGDTGKQRVLLALIGENPAWFGAGTGVAVDYNIIP